jgi:hypothetical protein
MRVGSGPDQIGAAASSWLRPDIACIHNAVASPSLPAAHKGDGNGWPGKGLRHDCACICARFPALCQRTW